MHIAFVEIVQHHRRNGQLSGKLVCPAVQCKDDGIARQHIFICAKEPFFQFAAKNTGNGEVLDIFVQSRRNKRAVDKFFRKLFKQFGMPRVVITDKLGSYGAA